MMSVSKDLEWLSRRTAEYRSYMDDAMGVAEDLGGVCFQLFVIFFISFQEIQKLDDIKTELEAPFHELLNFSFFRAIELLDLLKANPKK
jgi:hypothetical protein